MISQPNLFSNEDVLWTVSDLNGYIKELIDIDYRLRELLVTGEVSNFSRAKSGHVYFTLKDDQSQMRCVMWARSANRSTFMPVDGDAVIAHGRISVYETMGQYQLYVDNLEPAGRGDLARAFEQLKERLAAEGLFDAEYKKSIPTFPRKIGIVTSADAAALRDIRTVLKRRWPLVSVLLAPSLVQGRDAPSQLIQAIQWLDSRNDVDIIIFSRGGGSIEDLWAFNDEGVARSIFEADHPVITGVGHETDFTIADFVADLRAPTPSAAAELAVPDQAEILEQVNSLKDSMRSDMKSLLNRQDVYLDGLRRALKNLSPRGTLDSKRQHIDWLFGRMDRALSVHLDRAETRVENMVSRLVAVSPISTLSRGYAIVRKKEGSIVRSIRDVASGDELEIHVSDGDFEATAD